MTVWIDGRFVGPEDAVVSVFDHGLLYGDGVFEGLRVYGGRVFKLKEHVQRLFESAHAIMLELSMGPEEMCALVEDVVSQDGNSESYIRLVLTRGKGGLGLDPASCERASLIIIVDRISLYPDELYERGLDIMTASVRRVPPESLDPRIKSLNYLNNVLARAEASRSGCHEALMLNTQGLVAECSADNIFVVRRGLLLTPHPSCGALEGITMRTVMELAVNAVNMEDLLGAEFGWLTPHDLYTADECFLTGTGAEIVPVATIDGRRVGQGGAGPVTLRLMDAYRALVGLERVGL